MKSIKGRVIAVICMVLLLSMVISDAFGKPRKEKSSNPVINFLEENGVDLDKKVVAIRVSGHQLSETGPRSVVKIIAIREGLTEGAKKMNTEVIKTVIASIKGGTIIDTGETSKVADLEVFLEDGSSFKVIIGETFSQIVFERIIKEPENPFSSEPPEKEVKVLSFVSLELSESIRVILQPKEEKE